MTDEVIAKPKKIHKNKLKPPNPYGRPEKEVDWEKVDYLLECGCTGTEVAACFDIHPTTFYNKVEAKYNMTFTAYSQQREFTGNALIRVKQHEKAVSGDNMMMIWLGKNRLKQSDTPVQDNINEKAFEKFEKVMGQLDSLQSARNIDDTSNNKDAKS
jgi:hypothetical protein